MPGARLSGDQEGTAISGSGSTRRILEASTSEILRRHIRRGDPDADPRQRLNRDVYIGDNCFIGAHAIIHRPA
jgi:acetyltransferase-like isoleucine patch superfamily enzyme